MAAPNLVAITSVYGKTTSTTVGTAATVLVSNPASSNKSYKVNAIYIANVDNTNASKVSIDFYRSSTSIRLVDRMSVNPGDTLVAISRDSAVYLEEGDSLRCYSDIVGITHVVVTYEINA
jgi:hypothetical protein